MKKSRKGELMTDFLSALIVAFIIVVIFAVIALLMAAKARNKKELVDYDLNVRDGFYTTRMLLNDDTDRGEKVYQLVAETVKTGDYNNFYSEIAKIIQEYYPEGRLVDNWIIIINNECTLVGVEGVKESTEVISTAVGGKLVLQEIDKCNDSIIDLPKVTVPNMERDNILVLFKPYEAIDEKNLRVFGYRAGLLKGYSFDVASGGRVSIKNIPNVICTEKGSECGRICEASPEYALKLKEFSDKELVPRNMLLKVTQAYRTYDIQKCLYDDYCAKGKCDMACNPDGEECGHMIAGAVDFVLEIDGKELNGKESSDADKRYVEQLMCSYGFIRWHKEAWHFEYGTKNWKILNPQRVNGVGEPCRY